MSFRSGSPRFRALARAVGCGALLFASGCHGLLIRPTFTHGERVVETRTFRIESDLSAGALLAVAEAAEAMETELTNLAPFHETRVEKLPVVVFSDVDRFKVYLHAHLFAHERAIGFYCDLGGECALAWTEPHGPEDLRVLRHELVHQYLARGGAGSLPSWLEEGVAERLALGHAPLQSPAICSVGGPVAAIEPEPGAPFAERWERYRAHRFAIDSVFGALELQSGVSSWPGRLREPTSKVPPPEWADGDRGYVLHLLFVRFLEEIGEGFDGALGDAVEHAWSGEAGVLDLSGRFHTLGELERAFHTFVVSEGLRALVEEPDL